MIKQFWLFIRKWILVPTIRPLLILGDYFLALLALLSLILLLLPLSPYLYKLRRKWQERGKGQAHLLVLNEFTFASVEELGIEQLTPLRCSALDQITFMIPASSDEGVIEDKSDFKLIVRKEPSWYSWMCAKRLQAFAQVILESLVLWRLLHFVVNEEVGIVRAFQHHYPALRGALLSKILDIPLLIDICGNYELLSRWCGVPCYCGRLSLVPGLHGFARYIDRKLLSWPLRHCFHMLGRNKNNYEHGFALGANVERASMIRISNWGHQYKEHDPASPPPSPLDKPYILLVGRLEWEKFPADILHCFEAIAEDYPDLHLVLVGGGTLLHETRESAAASPYHERILVTGPLSIAETYQWTAHASIGWMPFAGATLVEANLCQVPVLAYDIEWQGELVLDRYTGLLCSFRDLSDTEDKLRWLLDHPEDAMEMAKRAREVSLKVFNQDALREREASLYRKALGSSQGWFADEQRLQPVLTS